MNKKMEINRLWQQLGINPDQVEQDCLKDKLIHLSSKKTG
jgi:hypothetical protein